MWQLDNRTPFASERCFTRDKAGAEVWLVAVKATFSIDPDSGDLDVATEQPPVCLAPMYTGLAGKSSLLYDNDLVPNKPGTDIIVNCQAYAPNSQPAPVVVVGLAVGRLYKQLYVVGDRSWRQDARGLAISMPTPFTKMPIVYERAFGGGIDDEMDMRNPIGTGFGMSLESATKQSMPNIFYEYDEDADWSNTQPPAGFGVIGSHWLPRSSYAGTMDDHYFQSVYPLLPKDLDEGFYRAAPSDQQCKDYLKGGETVVLTNMSANGHIEFKLPRMRLGFDTRFASGVTHTIGRLHTVIIEPDNNRVSLVWHSRLPCHNKEDQLEKTLIFEKNFPLNHHG